jgi:hypothetical protein
MVENEQVYKNNRMVINIAVVFVEEKKANLGCICAIKYFPRFL